MKRSPHYPLMSRSRVLLMACWMFLFTGFAMPALGETKSQITGVKVDGDKGMVSISFKGDPGGVHANLLPKPNRLVVSLTATDVEKLRGKIKSSEWGLNEIRVGGENSKAKVVLDFGNNPVPPYSIKRDKGLVMVVLVDSQATESTKGDTPKVPTEQGAASTQIASADNANEQTSTEKKSSLGQWIGAGLKPKDKEKPDTVAQSAPWAEPARAPASEDNTAFQQEESTQKTEQVLAQATDSSQVDLRPPAPPPMRRIQPADKPDTARGQNSSQSGSSFPSQATTPARVPVPNQTSTSARSPFPRPPESGNSLRQGNGPPITPPEPDPRLLVQELTELKFIQVGHNSRLYICGGDHLDYRLDRVSETKLKLDLVNAEIPKAFQKPLRTDLFATAVEMIVPGSQTIFIQLKEAAPYKVQKKKGVLTVDFSPPRFELTQEMKASGKSSTRQVGPNMNDQTAARQTANDPEGPEDCNTAPEGVVCLQKNINKWLLEREKRGGYNTFPVSEALNNKITMDFQDISLKNAFRLMSDQAVLNITVDPEVEGRITLRLQDVKVSEAIKTILITNELAMVWIGDDVLRIGTKKRINAFLDENQVKINELDDRITAARNKIKDIEARKEKRENPLLNREGQAAHEIGDAGCFRVKEEEICMRMEVVKLVYADPEKIVKVLDAMFNEKSQTKGADGQSAQGLADQRKRSELQETAKLAEQGFTPDSPGGQDRLRNAAAQLRDTQRTDAQIASSLGKRPDDTSGTGASGLKDPRLAAIIQNSSLTADPDFSRIFIKDTADRIHQMKKVIYSLDVPVPQVSIESRIVQTTRDWGRTLGVMWGGRNNQYGTVDGKKAFWGITGNQQSPLVAPGGTGPANTATGSGTWVPTQAQPPGTSTIPSGAALPPLNIPSTYAVNLPALPLLAGKVPGLLADPVGVGLQFGLLGAQYVSELDARIQAGEAQHLLKQIARPKVQVLDRKEASIMKGVEIPYQSTSAMAGTQVQFKDAILELKVTPTIYSDSKIEMKLDIRDDYPDVPLNGQVSIGKRRAKTVMVVRDGETCVIGGVNREEQLNQQTGLPGLKNIPLIGYLFGNKRTEKEVLELFIFITPTIVKRPPQAS